MNFDLETMNSVRMEPFGQVFWPDHIVFGHTGNGNKLAKGYRVLHLHEIVIPRTTARSSSVGNFTTLVESSGQVEFWVPLTLVWVCFCVWFPLGACSCSVALLSFGRLVLRTRGMDVISRLQHSSAVACPRKSLMSKC